jgi:hypothetical protein
MDLVRFQKVPLQVDFVQTEFKMTVIPTFAFHTRVKVGLYGVGEQRLRQWQVMVRLVPLGHLAKHAGSVLIMTAVVTFAFAVAN